MSLTEKISYIKGYAEGLNLDQNKDEVKVLNKIMDLLDDMAASVAELEECYDESVDIIDAINDDLSLLEDTVYDDCDGSCCNCDDEDDETALYEVTCPECEEKIVVTEDQLLNGEVECPNCEAILEFDFSEFTDDVPDEESEDLPEDLN